MDMAPVEGTVDLDIPIAVLWNCFRRADWWSRWNHCFFWVQNKDLVQGQTLTWCFQPIRPEYLYKMPALARIATVDPQRRVTWEVQVIPGFFARHTYHMEDIGEGRTRFGSWEQAHGPSFRLMRGFWAAHFTFVLKESLEAGRRLERIYQQKGELTDRTLPRAGQRSTS